MFYIIIYFLGILITSFIGSLLKVDSDDILVSSVLWPLTVITAVGGVLILIIGGLFVIPAELGRLLGQLLRKRK